MSEPKVLWDATFDPKVKSYYLWSTSLILCATIVGIPLAIIYIILGNWLIQKHLNNLGCTLSEKTLDIKKGIVNKTESTIPLEKITDLQMFQGPIMRHFGLRGFKVETAGQSSGPGGSLVNIIGIVDAIEFRKAVLQQRDELNTGSGSQSNASHLVDSAPPSLNADTLVEIRDILVKIESKLNS
ncbi:MAG: PH domain-containing protein [Phycisphaerales bacterium]